MFSHLFCVFDDESNIFHRPFLCRWQFPIEIMHFNYIFFFFHSRDTSNDPMEYPMSRWSFVYFCRKMNERKMLLNAAKQSNRIFYILTRHAGMNFAAMKCENDDAIEWKIITETLAIRCDNFQRRHIDGIRWGNSNYSVECVFGDD